MLNRYDTPLSSCEVKFAGSGMIEGQFSAYASKFNGCDSYNDTIHPGAFEDTLKDRRQPVRMFWQHNPDVPIGKWMELREDEIGLLGLGEFTPNNTHAGNAYASLRHGAIDSMSIGFRLQKNYYKMKKRECDCAEDDIWCPHPQGRDIFKIDLIEISPVSLPADSGATVNSIKSIETISSLKDAELLLRESAYFSRKMAVTFVSQIRKLAQSDSDKALRDQIANLERQLKCQKAQEQLENIFDRYDLSKLIGDIK